MTTSNRPCVDCGEPMHHLATKQVRCRDCRASSEMKVCCRCSRDLPFAAFNANPDKSDGRQSLCRGCHAEAVRVGRSTGRHTYLRYRFGISFEEYQTRLEAQGGVCAIPGCGRSPEENGQALAVDHDHGCCPGKRSCGDCVRGLVCGHCNRGLGFFRDAPAVLRGAAEYLEAA